MNYFKFFPQIVDSQERIITNITKKVLIAKSLSDDSVMYYTYKIKDGERLDVLAKRLYDDESLQWILALVNNMIDPRFDVPLTTYEFDQYIIDQYGSVSAAQSEIHHYHDEDGNIVDEQYEGYKYSVSVYDYEEEKNEAKRSIRVVRQEYIQLFVDELERIFA